MSVSYVKKVKECYDSNTVVILEYKSLPYIFPKFEARVTETLTELNTGKILEVAEYRVSEWILHNREIFWE